MNPQGPDRLPSLDLPKPQTEQLTQGSEVLPFDTPSERDNSIAIEQGAQPQAAPGQAPAIAPVQTSAVPQTPLNQSASMAAPASPAGTPAIADDADLIEKEWVEKAKEIVEKTKADPYVQNKELNKMKADYMKKRYNKDLKPQ